MNRDHVRPGVARPGRAFMPTLPILVQHPGIRLVATANCRLSARGRFRQELDVRTYDTAGTMCAGPAPNAIDIATPHQFHVKHVQAATTAREHILVEKPMALTLEECAAVVAAAGTAGVQLLMGHSHSFDRRAKMLGETTGYSVSPIHFDRRKP